MKVRSKYYIASLLSILAVSGCSSESTTSNVVKTEGIWTEIRVTANGERARVVSEFNLNSSTGSNIILTTGDKVQATVGSETKQLTMDEDLLDIDYQGYFSQTAKDTNFKLELFRESENETLVSEVKLPTPVTIYSPVSSSFQRNSDILVEWQPASDEGTQLVLQFTASCTTNTDGMTTFGHSAEIDDKQGQYTLLLSEIEGFDDTTFDKNKPCESRVTLSRIRTGNTDSRFKSGSSIKAIQEKESEEFKITLN